MGRALVALSAQVDDGRAEGMDVVIVGGGLSGMVAAWRVLSDAESASPRVARVRVLEAQPRVGGRAFSTTDGLDLGGSWVWVDNFPATVKLVREVGRDRNDKSSFLCFRASVSCVGTRVCLTT